MRTVSNPRIEQDDETGICPTSCHEDPHVGLSLEKPAATGKRGDRSKIFEQLRRVRPVNPLRDLGKKKIALRKNRKP